MSQFLRPLIYKAFSFAGSFEVKALESACQNTRAAQVEKLKRIVSANAGTSYGRQCGFASITDPIAYRKAVPIHTYESLSPYIDRMVGGEQNVLVTEEPFMFATTSGTTGKAKYIPVTDGYIKEFRHASIASGYYTLANHPTIPKGVTLSIFSGACEGHTEGGKPFGAISGALYLREPALVKRMIAPIPYPVYLIRDYESRYYTILRAALSLPVTVFYTLNPSTIAALCRRLKFYGPQLVKDIAQGTLTSPEPASQEVLHSMAAILQPDRQLAKRLDILLQNDQWTAEKIWPNLSVICCWTKASAAFYLQDFPEQFGSVPICDISYGASEGRGTVSLGDGRQLLSLRSHFFEFVPEDEIDNQEPNILLADELEVGKNYYILFTTSAGLYRYNINDVVKVTGKLFQAPLIEFQYKGGNVSSFTGEKITELQVTRAMTQALGKLNLRCRFFTLIPTFKPEPHYKLLVEPEQEQESKFIEMIERLAQEFDASLKEHNIEYAGKRDSHRLDPVNAALVAGGTYDAMRRHLTSQGVADAQIKLSHLNPKEETKVFFESAAL